MGFQSDNGFTTIKREELAGLRAQLADAKSNEERVVAEVGELTMKLHTLEAAVRAVRVDRESDGHNDDWGLLRPLFELVPEDS